MINPALEPRTAVEAFRCCPLCLDDLEPDLQADALRCRGCQHSFERNASNQWDLRVPAGVSVRYRDEYRPRSVEAPRRVPVRLEGPCQVPRNRYAGEPPWHLTRGQITYIPEAKPGQIALDHGCGIGPHRPLLEDLGYIYHGIDIEGAAAQDLVDAHALPYRESVFHLVVSVGVLGQLEKPALAVREISRVLAPGGYLVGTVPFLEPFNGMGCFNFTHFGLWATLDGAGFDVDAILCIRRWNALRAQLHMGFDWRMPEGAADRLSRPFVWMLEAYGALGRRFARNRAQYDRDWINARHSGAFYFVATKRPEKAEGCTTLDIPVGR